MVSSFNLADLQQQPIALLSALTKSSMRGNEVALANYLEEVLLKAAPHWKVVSQQEMVSRINRQGLTHEYTMMRADYEQSNILDRDVLRKIGSAVGARYAFQLRLADFSQTMTERWQLPVMRVRMLETRSSIMRVLLQLWDLETGELLWASVAESTMQNEAVSQDPVYLGDIARATLGSMVSDFLNRKTASQYTPVNKFLDNMIREAMPEEQPEQEDENEKSGESDPVVE